MTGHFMLKYNYPFYVGHTVAFIYICMYVCIMGYAVAQLVETGRSRLRFPMESLEFFSDLILPVALWPWGRLSL
jgi:hypothetical protein